jgi:hypothetical protein
VLAVAPPCKPKPRPCCGKKRARARPTTTTSCRSPCTGPSGAQPRSVRQSSDQEVQQSDQDVNGANVCKRGQGMHGSIPAADLSASYLASSGGCGCEMQPRLHPHVLRSSLPAPPPVPPPLSVQTTRILTTEVVATSQMHLGRRMFREGGVSSLLSWPSPMRQPRNVRVLTGSRAVLTSL